MQPGAVRAAWAGLLLAMVAAPAGAAEPWKLEPFSAPAAALAAAARSIPAPPGGPSIYVLLEESEYRFEADGRCSSRYRLVYRVEDGQARNGWDTIEAAWAPWHQERPQLQARVVAGDGRERQLDLATVTEAVLGTPEDGIFSDRRQLSAPLPALERGAIVEQQSIVRDDSPWFEAGSTWTFDFGGSVPVRQARLILDAPAVLPLRWSAQLLPGFEPRREESGGRVRLTFEKRDLAPVKAAEPGLPPDVPRRPRVALSTGASWQSVARAYDALVERQLARADLRELARRTAGRMDDRRAVVERLVARLHADVRYTGVELGEAAFVPRTPAETLARGYGDCKDKAVLLVGLLRALGIPARVALLSSGFGQDVETGLPGLGGFNHAIVHVPGPPEMWIDATVERARAGDLPLSDQGRLALVASAETAALVRTPEAPSQRNGSVELREFRLAEQGPARVLESTEYHGSYERDFRGQYADSNAETNRETLSEYVGAEYLATLGSFEVGDVDDLSRPFGLKLEALQAKRGATDEREAVVAFFPGALVRDLPEAIVGAEEKAGSPPPEREAPYFFANPHYTEQRYRIVLPAGYRLRELPPSEDVALGPGRLSIAWQGGPDGILTGRLRVDTGPRRITAQEFVALRQAVRALRQRPASLIHFDQVGETLLAQGRVQESLREFQALVALHPKEGLHHTQVALALLTAGMGEAARVEAQRAVAVEPGSFLAQRRLGWVLQHDLVGRRFGRGFDMEAAESAYRRALELAPEDVSTRQNLAFLLEHNAKGERYGEGAKIGEAADQFWQLSRQPGEHMTNLVYDLLYAGRWGELPDAARTFEDASLRDGFEVLSAAVLEGVPAAQRRAGQIVKAEPRRQALQDAADRLVRLRRYAEAAELLRAASQGAPNAAALRERSDLLARVRRVENDGDVEPGPDGVVRTLLRGLLLGWNATRLQALFHPGSEQSAPTTDEDLAPLRRMFERARQAAELPTAVYADVTLSAALLSAEGEDAAGYRVRLRAGSQAQVLYVVKDEAGYRILTSSRNLEELAAEALRRTEAGDLAGAGRLLDWARDETGGDAADALDGHPLALFWGAGHASSPDELRFACAALLVRHPRTAERGIRLLQAGRETAQDEAARARFDRALVDGFSAAGRWAEGLAVLERLEPLGQASERLRFQRLMQLEQLERWGELQGVAERTLLLKPNDVWANRALRRALEQRGDFSAAEAVCARWLGSGLARAHDYNECAWNALLADLPLDKAIERSRRAVELTGRSEWSYLHTLAALHAEADQPAEARQVIVEGMAVSGHDQPQAEDWYVFGRIAEDYGLREAALSAYARGPEKSKTQRGTATLVRRRVAGLVAPPKGGGPRQRKPGGSPL